MLSARTGLVVLTSVVVSLVLAACSGGDGGDAATTQSTTTAAAVTGNPTAGAAVFEQAGCGGCHTLAASGSDGSSGPNLDDLKPGLAAVVSQVTDGGGGMPAYKDQLTAQQIADVAAYIVESTGGG